MRSLIVNIILLFSYIGVNAQHNDQIITINRDTFYCQINDYVDSTFHIEYFYLIDSLVYAYIPFEDVYYYEWNSSVNPDSIITYENDRLYDESLLSNETDEYFNANAVIPISEFYTPDNLLDLDIVEVPLYYGSMWGYIPLQFTRYNHHYNSKGKLRYKSIGLFGSNIKEVLEVSPNAMGYYTTFRQKRFLGSSLCFVVSPTILVASSLNYYQGNNTTGGLLLISSFVAQIAGLIYVYDVSHGDLRKAVDAYNEDLLERYE